MFAISGENLTVRIRRLTLESMLRQEIGWFDREENNTGTLTTRLATDASAVQGVSSMYHCITEIHVKRLAPNFGQRVLTPNSGHK